MRMNSQPPIRTGLLDFFRNSSGCQFVIPVYQRNYTWTAVREVKQLLNDLEKVLTGEYNNHFLGIMIYLDKPIDFSAREFSVIDGQQRLTTIFLALYAIRELFKEQEMVPELDALDGQYLTNPYASKKLKYKLKPLVADDNVYQHIVAGTTERIEDKQSNVYKNYIYIFGYLRRLIQKHTLNEILMALNNLYIVCVPLGEDDNAQKIFESINSTGVKLTASDLIRNFLLMDMSSEKQEYFYSGYWKPLERLFGGDAQKLEGFFRFFLAIQTKTLPNKNVVYKVFVDWFQDVIDEYEIEAVFRQIVQYGDYHYAIYKQDYAKLPTEIVGALREFRRILSDMPAPLFMEFFKLHNEGNISEAQLCELITIVNSYLMRRALCDLDTSSISRLFPALIKDMLADCDGDYRNIAEILKKNLVNKNVGNGMYMPDDTQLVDLIAQANMYSIRVTLRIFLDKLEHHNNSAPVDLSTLNVEHIMPQSPTTEWYDELRINEDTYQRNVHRLGNLTLASKTDNSAMKNSVWSYKTRILADTSHLKINEELLKVERWTIEEIDKRTHFLIGKIMELYPYVSAKVDVIPKKAIYIKSSTIQASGFLNLDNGSVEIDAGSELHMFENAENYSDIEDQRKALLEDNIIAATEQGLVFVRPHVFHSNRANYTA